MVQRVWTELLGLRCGKSHHISDLATEDLIPWVQPLEMQLVPNVGGQASRKLELGHRFDSTIVGGTS